MGEESARSKTPCSLESVIVRLDGIEKRMDARFDSHRSDMDLRFKMMDERHHSQKEALKLQATEYERRLDALNGEAARIAAAANAHVPREVFDRSMAEHLRRISEGENFQANLQGRIWAVGFVITIINVAASFYFSTK